MKTGFGSETSSTPLEIFSHCCSGQICECSYQLLAGATCQCLALGLQLAPLNPAQGISVNTHLVPGQCMLEAGLRAPCRASHCWSRSCWTNTFHFSPSWMVGPELLFIRPLSVSSQAAWNVAAPITHYQVPLPPSLLWCLSPG